MNNLKKLRETKNITQDEIAKYMNVTVATVSRWENGLLLPRADKLKPLALLLNCTVDELLEGGVVE